MSNPYEASKLPARDVVSLADLSVGSSGRVVSIEGADGVALRLLEMGLTPGLDISLIGMAPLGDPLEIELRGYRLSLRRTEAARVRIEPAPAT